MVPGKSSIFEWILGQIIRLGNDGEEGDEQRIPKRHGNIAIALKPVIVQKLKASWSTMDKTI